MLFSGTAAVLAKRFYKAHMAGDTYGVEQAEAACRAALEAEVSRKIIAEIWVAFFQDLSDNPDDRRARYSAAARGWLLA